MVITAATGRSKIVKGIIASLMVFALSASTLAVVYSPIVNVSPSGYSISASLLIALFFVAKVKITNRFSDEGFVYYRAALDISIAVSFVICGMLLVQFSEPSTEAFFPVLIKSLLPNQPASVAFNVIGSLVTAISILATVVCYFLCTRVHEVIQTRQTKMYWKYNTPVLLLFGFNYSLYTVLMVCRI